MQVFRITHAKWAQSLQGSGLEARWNKRGRFVCYAAESRALACLENLVHRSGEGLNANFRLVVITIPDKLKIQTVSKECLPKGWTTERYLTHTQQIGEKWLTKATHPILKVPSSIISDESNFVMNPSHPDFKQISIAGVYPFQFDGRLM